MDKSPCHHESTVASTFEKHHILRLPHRPYSPEGSPCNFWFFGLLKEIVKDRRFHSHGESEEAISMAWNDLTFGTFRASSTTGCTALHGSFNMKESIFLNKNEMVSFYWVDVEIGRGLGLSLHAVEMITIRWQMESGVKLQIKSSELW
jgi:hypothetical protein